MAKKNSPESNGFNPERRWLLKAGTAAAVVASLERLLPRAASASLPDFEGPRFGGVCLPEVQLEEAELKKIPDLLTALKKDGKDGKMEVIANTEEGIVTGLTLVIDPLNKRIVRYQNSVAVDILTLEKLPDNSVVCSGAGGNLGRIAGQPEDIFIANPKEFGEIVIGTVDTNNGRLAGPTGSVTVTPIAVVGLDGRYKQPNSLITGVGYHAFRGPRGEKFNVDSIAGQDNFTIPRFAKIVGIGDQVDRSKIQLYGFTESEKLLAPLIEGCDQKIIHFKGKDMVSYWINHVGAGLYGLKEGQPGGLFAPDVYDGKDMVGGAGFRAEIIKKRLEKAGSPVPNLVFPLPFDFSEQPGKVVIEYARDNFFDTNVVFVDLPEESRIVVPFTYTGKNEMSVTAIQATRAIVLDFGSPGSGNYLPFGLEIGIMGRRLVGRAYRNITKRLGDPVEVVRAGKLPDVTISNLEKYMSPVPSKDTDINIQIVNFFSNSNNNSGFVSTGRNNFLYIERSYLFPLSNDNSLLN